MSKNLNQAFALKFTSEFTVFLSLVTAFGGDLFRSLLFLSASYIFRMIFIYIEERHLKQSKTKGDN